MQIADLLSIVLAGVRMRALVKGARGVLRGSYAWLGV